MLTHRYERAWTVVDRPFVRDSFLESLLHKLEILNGTPTDHKKQVKVSIPIRATAIKILMGLGELMTPFIIIGLLQQKVKQGLFIDYNYYTTQGLVIDYTRRVELFRLFVSACGSTVSTHACSYGIFELTHHAQANMTVLPLHLMSLRIPHSMPHREASEGVVSSAACVESCLGFRTLVLRIYCACTMKKPCSLVRVARTHR